MKPQRAWQRMLSGRRLDLLDPSPLDIEIEDIAHGLAFVARWNGQTHGDYPYSVAEHSVFVLELYRRLHPKADRKWQLAALLHDAPEYVIGDMISPVKAAIGPDYAAMDKRLTAAIHLRFGLPPELPASIKKQIKRADRISAWLEAVQIAGFSQEEADKLFGKPVFDDIPDRSLRPHPPMESKGAFMEVFTDLTES
nr:HD family hydrolase [Amylibacter sp.]